MKKHEILTLNNNYLPIRVTDWKSAMIGIMSGAFYPLDISYEEDGEEINTEKISSFQVIRDFSEWQNLDIRPYDQYIGTAKKPIRLPTIIICARYDQIPLKRVVFPSKSNIYKRDNFTCGYSGKKLSKDQLSIDHIIPKSRGGLNTWENLITCDKELNRKKDNQTPQEAGLKLLWKPFKPAGALNFPYMKKEWEIFINGGTFD